MPNWNFVLTLIMAVASIACTDFDQICENDVLIGSGYFDRNVKIYTLEINKKINHLHTYIRYDTYILKIRYIHMVPIYYL